MKIHRPARKTGFTLVELLIVIAIIVTLAGLTIFAVKAAREASRAAEVTSQMKNIYNAVTLLKGDGVNTGFHPPNTFPPYEGSFQDAQRTEFTWWDLVAEKMTIARRDGQDFIWLTPYSESELQNPLSEKKLGAGKKEFDSLLDEPELSFGGFAYNAALGDSAFEDERMDRINVVRDNALKDPASTILFAECADVREPGDTTPGWYFSEVKNAPQGNYKESAHCCMVSGNIQLIKNAALKNPDTFLFLTSLEEKNYDHKP